MASYAREFASSELTSDSENESWGSARQHIRSCVSVMTPPRNIPAHALSMALEVAKFAIMVANHRVDLSFLCAQVSHLKALPAGTAVTSVDGTIRDQSAREAFWKWRWL